MNAFLITRPPIENCIIQAGVRYCEKPYIYEGNLKGFLISLFITVLVMGVFILLKTKGRPKR